MVETTVRPVEAGDRDRVRRFVRERWVAERMVGHGELFFPAEHDGFLALRHEEIAGLVTYRIDGKACEITLIDACTRSIGIGSRLLEAVEGAARPRAYAVRWRL